VSLLTHPIDDSDDIPSGYEPNMMLNVRINEIVSLRIDGNERRRRTECGCITGYTSTMVPAFVEAAVAVPRLVLTHETITATAEVAE
jgi:hypothetical protein